MVDSAILMIKGFFILILLAGVYMDVEFRKIPNVIPLLIFEMGICRVGVDNTLSFSAAVIGALIPLVLFCIIEFINRGNVIGGGDYKLFMAIGFILGCPDILSMMFVSFLAAFIYSIARKRKSLPLCPFAFLGSLLIFL